MSRRRFGAIAGSFVASCALGGACDSGSASIGAARLTARPRNHVKTSFAGTRALGLDRARDAILRLPPAATSRPLALVVLFHGAGGSGDGLLEHFGPVADAAGVAVLAPDSRRSTWDAVRGGFGADVTFLDRALDRVFGMVAVDPARVAAGGFSDGASYALSLGLINGDLFPSVLAFSPGFMVEGAPHGRPRFFVSHGTADTILPIDRCSRMIVPALRNRGYRVTFREFEGGHHVPDAIAREALAWI